MTIKIQLKIRSNIRDNCRKFSSKFIGHTNYKIFRIFFWEKLWNSMYTIIENFIKIMTLFEEKWPI